MPYFQPTINPIVNFGPSAFTFEYHTIVSFTSTGRLYLEVYGNSVTPIGKVTASTAIVLNQWTHIAVSWDGTTASAYLNGVQVGASSTGVGGFVGTRNRDNCFFGYPGFTGSIDEIRFYDR